MFLYIRIEEKKPIKSSLWENALRAFSFVVNESGEVLSQASLNLPTLAQ